jgi:hypothetical protein
MGAGRAGRLSDSANETAARFPADRVLRPSRWGSDRVHLCGHCCDSFKEPFRADIIRVMSELERMPAVTFRGTKKQRGYNKGVTILFFMLGIASFAFSPSAGSDAKGFLGGGVVFLILGILGVLGRGAHTTIDSHGVDGTSGLLRRNRSIAWSDIAEIDSKVSSSDGDWYEYVRIKPYSGRAFSLSVPRNSSSKSVSNSQFDEDLATIRTYWQRGKATSDKYQDPVS